MTLKTDDQRNKRTKKFHFLVSQLASYNKPVSEEGKESKSLSTLPPWFVPFYMVTETSDVSFEKVVASGKTEIFRRSKQEEYKPTPFTIVSSIEKEREKLNRLRVKFTKHQGTSVFFAADEGIMKATAGIETWHIISVDIKKVVHSVAMEDSEAAAVALIILEIFNIQIQCPSSVVKMDYRTDKEFNFNLDSIMGISLRSQVSFRRICNLKIRSFTANSWLS